MVANPSRARAWENHLVRKKRMSEAWIFQVPEFAFVFILLIFFFMTEGNNTLNILHFTAVAKHIMHSLYSYIGEKSH